MHQITSYPHHSNKPNQHRYYAFPLLICHSSTCILENRAVKFHIYRFSQRFFTYRAEFSFRTASERSLWKDKKGGGRNKGWNQGIKKKSGGKGDWMVDAFGGHQQGIQTSQNLAPPSSSEDKWTPLTPSLLFTPLSPFTQSFSFSLVYPSFLSIWCRVHFCH